MRNQTRISNLILRRQAGRSLLAHATWDVANPVGMDAVIQPERSEASSIFFKNKDARARTEILIV